MTIEKGELATSVEKKKYKRKSSILTMLGRATASLIAFIFGVLVNVGKKIVRLQCGFKS